MTNELLLKTLLTAGEEVLICANCKQGVKEHLEEDGTCLFAPKSKFVASFPVGFTRDEV